MATIAKPESSYASTRLTRRNNNNRGPPLTQVMGRKIQGNDDRTEKSETSSSIKPEPATDDEPESSSNDEDEGSDGGLSDDLGDRRRTREPRMSLQEKLEANDAAAPRGVDRMTRSSQRSGNGDSEAQMSQKRGTSFGGAEDDEELFWSASQNSKRARTRTYASKASRNLASLNIASSQPGPGSAVSNSRKETKADSRAKDEEEGFKFPVEVDLGSSQAHAGTKENNDVKPTAISSSSAEDRWFFDDDDSAPSTPLSSASSSFLLELSQVDDSLAAEAGTKQSLCPVCKKQVVPERLQTFLSQPKQRIREQLQFCESHQQTSAEQEWQERGYPSIDWETVNERMCGHFADLEQLLVPDNPSFYRNVLVSALKSGKAKNFRLTLDGDALEMIACGYYGTRGASEM